MLTAPNLASDNSARKVENKYLGPQGPFQDPGRFNPPPCRSSPTYVSTYVIRRFLLNIIYIKNAALFSNLLLRYFNNRIITEYANEMNFQLLILHV